jgi:hypothetical protein
MSGSIELGQEGSAAQRTEPGLGRRRADPETWSDYTDEAGERARSRATKYSSIPIDKAGRAGQVRCVHRRGTTGRASRSLSC